jgi:phage shock protein PspC (stress-responsive transcriptional regulator)
MKRLYLSRTDKKIFGVCGGIAHYLGVDSTVVRLSMVLITLVFAGFPLLFYIAAWLIMPNEPGYRTIEMDK